jgi:hypothetical protein
MEALLPALPVHLTDPPPRPSWAALATPEGPAQEITASAPVMDPEIHVVDAPLVVPTPAALWRGLAGHPVTGALIARCTPPERDAARHAATAALERRAGGPDRPLTLHASAHILIARRIRIP